MLTVEAHRTNQTNIFLPVIVIIGVLLLNTVLTVQAHQANSHKDKGWEKFTDAVIRWLNRNNNGLIFLLWGSHAQKKGLAIDKVCYNYCDTCLI